MRTSWRGGVQYCSIERGSKVPKRGSATRTSKTGPGDARNRDRGWSQTALLGLASGSSPADLSTLVSPSWVPTSISAIRPEERQPGPSLGPVTGPIDRKRVRALYSTCHLSEDLMLGRDHGYMDHCHMGRCISLSEDPLHPLHPLHLSADQGSRAVVVLDLGGQQCHYYGLLDAQTSASFVSFVIASASLFPSDRNDQA